MKLKNGFDIQGNPNRAEYRRNENGLYTVDVKDYIITTLDGQKYYATLRFPSVKLSIVSDEQGIIDFDQEDMQFFGATNKNEQDDTIWTMFMPDVKDEYQGVNA